MKNVIIVGASGMIGSIVLRECIASTDIGNMISIVRRATDISDPRLVEIIHKDFNDYSALSAYFRNVDIGYFCIGAYTGQLPDDEFRIVTVDYAKSFASELKKQSPDATLCFLSGQGADPKEKSRMSFARYKGIAENFLISLKFKNLFIFRPGYIYPVKKRQEPNFSYRIMRGLYPIMKKVYAKGIITSEQLGKAMYKAGINGAHKSILENQDIKEV